MGVKPQLQFSHSREGGIPGAAVGLLHGKTSRTLYCLYAKQDNQKTLYPDHVLPPVR